MRTVTELHNGKENCERRSDYRAIVEHAISLADDDKHFADAPIGIACQGEFYQIVGDGIVKSKLIPEHRQKVMLNFKPVSIPIPLFMEFLHQTFKSENAGEEEQQIVLIQEISGAIMHRPDAALSEDGEIFRPVRPCR